MCVCEGKRSMSGNDRKREIVEMTYSEDLHIKDCCSILTFLVLLMLADSWTLDENGFRREKSGER